MIRVLVNFSIHFIGALIGVPVSAIDAAFFLRHVVLEDALAVSIDRRKIWKKARELGNGVRVRGTGMLGGASVSVRFGEAVLATKQRRRCKEKDLRDSSASGGSRDIRRKREEVSGSFVSCTFSESLGSFYGIQNQ
ncbi:hypothetical protein HZH68_016035 [Vespula germanica]|uniref:Uncharacterized protein n=1 Tax=Vespula germanica TaxID=30212 RepID=A0A834J462_VESGE|nr:hypothetical protein HZH68_016035 [Vespula germanica]